MNHELALETVFVFDEPVAIGLAKAALEEAGIEYLAQHDEVAARLTLAPPVMFPLCRIDVAAGRAVEARRVLGPLATGDGK